MKFVQKDLGEAAEVSSGGGGRGLGKEIATLAALAALAITIIYFVVVGLTEVAVAKLTPREEQALFSRLGDLSESDKVPRRLAEKFERCQAILTKLEAFEEVPDLDYTLIYQDNPDTNAFAIPGGTIAVTRGLLESLDEEISIAFVLGHELGHFAQRDHLRGMGRQFGFKIGVAILFGGDPGSLSSRASDLILAKYSRDQESGADEFGLRAVQAIYGKTEGAEALFEVLEKENAVPRWAYMFSTHPDNKARIRKILEAGK